MKKKLLAVLIALISVITLAFALPACNVSSDGRGSANNGANPGGNNDDNKEKIEHSKIMDALVQDDYYQDLVTQVWDNHLEIKNNMKPIPYKFLRNHGHNVDAYLDGTLNAFASSYIYDNDKNHIYVSVKAENVSNSQYGNYYTNYVLKYPLTNQEYEEYTYLCKDEYLQGLLFIQELDNQKTPEMLSKVNIAKYTYDYMIEYYPKGDKNPNKYQNLEVDVYYVDMTKICVSIRGINKSNLSKSTIGYIELSYKKMARPYEYDGDAIYVTDPTSVNYDIENYYTTIQNITSFSYGTNIKYANPYPNYKK